MALKKKLDSPPANIAGKRRSKMRIIADILRHAQRPAKKTQITYECNLSFNQLKRYLILLKKEPSFGEKSTMDQLSIRRRVMDKSF